MLSYLYNVYYALSANSTKDIEMDIFFQILKGFEN